jgi:DNA-binding transcriptional LysR family regulator
MVDPRKLRHFVVLAEELNFGRAAERCHLSQPAFSRSIARLERELGGALVIRTTRRVELTPLGARLSERTGALLESLDAVISDAREQARQQSQVLRVGFKAGAAGLLLTPTLKAFEERFPKIRLQLRRLEWAEQINAVLNTEVDIAFAWWFRDVRGVEHLPLVTESRIAGMALEHPLADRAELVLADLSDHAIVVSRSIAEESARWWSALPRPDGSVPPEGPVVESAEEMMEAVARNRGICLVSASVQATYGRPDVKFVPVVDAEPAQISLVWRQGDHRTPLALFGQIAVEVARSRAAADPRIRLAEPARLG